jgi:hypothetical protein
MSCCGVLLCTGTILALTTYRRLSLWRKRESNNEIYIFSRKLKTCEDVLSLTEINLFNINPKSVEADSGVRFLVWIAGLNPAVDMNVSMLRSLRRAIPRLEESYRVWCV